MVCLRSCRLRTTARVVLWHAGTEPVPSCLILPLNPLPQEHLIENEVSILRRVKHPNIIMLIEEMETATELFLVMELVKVRGGETPGESVSAGSRDLAVFSETLPGNARCCLETFVICEWVLIHLHGTWVIFFSPLLQADELCLSPHSPATVDFFN